MIAEFESMDDVLRASLAAIIRSGHNSSPRSVETKEILGWSFRLNNPRNRLIQSKSRHWNETLAIGELCWHLSGSDDVDFISYYSAKWASFSNDGRKIRGSCYGKRIFSDYCGHTSQWEMVKQILKEDSESRRAVLSFYSAEEGLQPNAVDQPCLSTVQFLIRDNQLHCFTTMRSNDVIWGLCYDAYFITMLQELLAVELGVALGFYQHSANSLHIYEPFYTMAKQILADPNPDCNGMPPMEDIEDIPVFLTVEAKLRQGDASAFGLVDQLHNYWRILAEPLLKRHVSKHVEKSAAIAAP